MDVRRPLDPAMEELGGRRTEPLRRTGLLVPAGIVWVAALAATAAPDLAPAVLLAGVPSAVLGALAARRRPGRRGPVLVVATAVLCAVLGIAVAAAEGRRHPPAVPVGRAAVLEVRVTEVRATSGNDGGGALAAGTLLRGTLVAVGEHRVPVATPVVLFGGGARPVPGSTVRLTAVLRAAAPADPAAYVGPVAGRIAVVSAAPPEQAVAADLRRGFVVATARLPGDGGALLPGLAIGDTTRVGPELQQAMRDSSLTHLTAVSGANCAVVVLGVLGLGALLRLPRGARIVLAAAALAGFVVLVTPQPSVIRAATMAAVGLVVLLRGGRAAGAPALAVAVLVLLLADPWLAWSAGFVLSVAATAGLLLLAPPIAARLARVVPAPLALMVAVPLAAQLACQPVLALLQPGIPLAGTVANLVAEPAAPVATVLGLIACLLQPVAPPLAGGIALLGWLPAAWIGLVARTAAAFPRIDQPAGLAGAVVAAVLLVVVVLLLARRTSSRLRRGAALLLLLTVLAAAGSTAGGAVGRLVGTPRDWSFAACDVGQGDGLVLSGGNGRYAVVDTGHDPGPILDCLQRLGVGRIDVLVLTHWDADHVGAARAISGRVRLALVGPTDGPPAEALRRDLAAAGATVRQVRRGDGFDLGRLHLDVLWPPDPLGAVEPGNDASVLLHVTGGGSSMLLTGDLGEQAQDAVLRAGPVPRVDLLKVAHHGSADTSPAFTAAAGALVGVISDGADNDYGHPTGRALRLLRAAGTLAVRTDQDGLVLAAWRDGRLALWTERPVTPAVWTPAK